MKIEPISLQPTTYRSEDGKQTIVMNANLTLDGLALKINEIIQHVNGVEASVEALSHSIPPKAPTCQQPEELGYIKLDEDSLKRFMESHEGQEIGKKYQTFISGHTITNPKIAEEIQKRTEQVWKEREISLVNHFQKAITGLQRIVTGEEKSKTEPDMRHDPEQFGCWVNVRILAQRALNELTLALSETGHDLKQMEEQL